jgi:hypothetical protein
MARKAKQTEALEKARAPVVVTVRRSTRTEAQTAGNGNLNRLLREAAWTRMFGRVEAKNPFTR